MNKLDIFNLMLKEDKLKKDLFEMAYRWGQWNIKADYGAPAFQEKLKELAKHFGKEDKYD